MKSRSLSTILRVFLMCGVFAAALDSPAIADDNSLDGGPEAYARRYCNRLMGQAEDESYPCNDTIYHCSDSSTWSAYFTGRNARDRRLCRNLAAITCCNSRGFLEAVQSRCPWIHRATFGALIDVGTSFLDACNSVRSIYNGLSLWVGHQNRTVAATYTPPGDSIRPLTPLEIEWMQRHEHGGHHPHTHEELPGHIVESEVPPPPPVVGGR